MQSKSSALQDQINGLDVKIQGAGNLSERNQLESERNELNNQLQVALAEEAQQERVQAQEAEVQAITLPYDFDELFSEEGHPVTGANDMIIEVVKDTKRQANVEKNQALDDLKADYESKIKFIQDQLDHQQNYGKETFEQLQALQHNYADLGEENTSLTSVVEKERVAKNQAEAAKVQAIFERDDAYSKRDSAFRQLQEARETIESLQNKIDNAPTAKHMFDISPSDKLAKMVKESLEAKVNRGLSRWPDIIPVMEPELDAVEELAEVAEPGPIDHNESQAADTETDSSVERDGTLDEMVEQTEQGSEVITLESLKSEVDKIKTYLGLAS